MPRDLKKNFLMLEDTSAGRSSRSGERSALAADALRRGGRLRMHVRGESMLPSVWPGDTVEIADCALEQIHPGEIVLALREDRLFLHRFLAHRGPDGFLLRGDSMAAPDPIFPSIAFHGKLIQIVRAGRTIPLTVPMRPWSRMLGVLLCYCGILRRLALKLHSWRTPQATSLPGPLVKNNQGAP
jgi:hypothetical protein